jgi:hypothetical protein
MMHWLKILLWIAVLILPGGILLLPLLVAALRTPRSVKGDAAQPALRSSCE